MKHRTFGKTGWQVSEIGFGAWGIGGGQWGGADEEESMAALHAAVDQGVTLFDTADVYGDGLSERLIARLRRERSEPLHVITKAGRRLSPHTAEGYNAENLSAFVDRSLTDRMSEWVLWQCLDHLRRGMAYRNQQQRLRLLAHGRSAMRVQIGYRSY